jgi:predicted adenine nucleotide alpha hydrolase (AANH) superfamily ATPase
MKVLLHACCGPCASYPLPALLDMGHSLYALYYNPNIHPFTEYEKRREGFYELARNYDLSVVGEEDYDPTPYLQAIAFREPQRCKMCYQLRLERAAQIARKGKFEAFTTSLIVSPYQKHELIKEVGLNCGEKYGVPFLYFDWRPYYPETVKRSRELGLYRQPYCGCLYSEWERYRQKGKKERHKP